MTDNTYERLKEYQKSKNMKNYQLVRELNIPENYLYRWKEKGLRGVWERVIDKFLSERGF